jgi:hypothetical protein
MNLQKKTSLLCLTLIIIVGLIYQYPIVFKGLYPGGTDVIGSVGAGNLMTQISEKTGERAMWNPAMFSGMPSYYKWYGVSYNLDTLLGQVFGWAMPLNALYFFIGAIGMFFLLRHFGIDPWVAAFVAIAMMFMLHYQILFQEGHFKKFRSVMLLPFLILSFIRLLEKPSLFNATFYILLQSVQIRTIHVQIVLYTAFILLGIGIWKLIELKKEGVSPLKPILVFIVSITVVLGIVSQPLFITKEYHPYSIRGNHTQKVQTADQKTQTIEKEGASYDYATNWSLPPSDFLSFLVPRFKGGASGVIYDGNNPKYRQAKGQTVPGYWGDMPFTASSEYVGVVILFFFFCGVYYYRKNRFIITILSILVFASIMSFGRHFPILYDLFYNYFPFFSSFRSPMMILVVVDLMILIVSGFGLHAITTKAFPKEELNKGFLISAGISFGIMALIYLFSSSLDYANAQDLARYKGPQLEAFKEIRMEMMLADLGRSFMIALLTAALVFLHLNEKIKKGFALFAIALLLLDLYPMAQRYLLHQKGRKYTHLNPLKNMSAAIYKDTAYDAFLLAQKRADLDLGEARLYPVDQQFWMTNKYSFHHQSIGGYSPAKMRIYQDLVDYGTTNRGLLSRNIIDMLNAKYLYSQFDLSRMQIDSLDLVFQKGKDLVFENKAAAGRAWFVGDVAIAKTLEERFALLNSNDFDIHTTAILESDLASAIAPPKNASVKTSKLSLHEAEFATSNDVSSLLVISEVYYPIGWKAFVDGKEVEIHKTNHVLRSVLVPAGNHTVRLEFYPESLKTYLTISTIFGPLTLALFFLSALLFLPQIRAKVPEKIRKVII